MEVPSGIATTDMVRGEGRGQGQRTKGEAREERETRTESNNGERGHASRSDRGLMSTR